MNRSWKSPLPILLALFATCCSGIVHGQQDHIPWKLDLESATDKASNEDKLLLLHFSASWCGPCKEIERFVFVNPLAIRAIAGQVVPVRIDIDEHPEIAERFGVSSVPYDVVITPSGHVVAERSSPRSADGYLQLIRIAQSGSANLSKDIASDVRELKREMLRQKKLAAKKTAQGEAGSSKKNSKVSGGALGPTSFAAANQDTSPLQVSRPWDETRVTNQPPAAKDGVVRNKFASRDSSFKPNERVAAASAQSPAAADTKDNRVVNISRSSQALQESSANGFSATTKGGNTPATLDRNTAFQHTPLRPGNELVGSRVEQAAENTASQFAGASTELNDNQLEKIVRAPQEPGKPRRIVNPMARSNQKVASSSSIGNTPKDNGPAPSFNVSSANSNASVATPPLGLEGYCSITLMEKKKWTRGNRNWGCMHRGRLYLFASQEYRDRFLTAPDSFCPLLGGADPVEFHEKGSLSDGKRRHGFFYGGGDQPEVIVLFSSSQNQARFEADPAAYVQTVRQAMSRVDGEKLLR